ncbi:DedA family protein [Microbacterium bovistercoris]|uniref:DedA family protein n=1 Tax=Microbacterium bovistercoris TaxID=2293570 RepID=A0A371NU27_9MICO|nr:MULTISPECIES: DedA family protein [Microbacterium]MVQ40851.1 DedA family protein [Microbacterium sp. MAH-37]REJ05871.1 DedA family protein [Microbacterium bovistercoris]
MDSTEQLGTIAEWAMSLMERLGSVGAGIAVALENLFPPIPSEIILPLAGFTARRGSLVLWEVLLWTTIGSVIGALLLYGLGAWLGPQRLRRIVDRMPLMKVTDVDRAEAWFARHGGKAVFLGRMVPIVRSLISIPAGIERMPLPRFLLLTAGGSAIWNSIFVLAGYFLGANWHLVEQYADLWQYVVIAAVGVAAAAFVVMRLRERAQGRMG